MLEVLQLPAANCEPLRFFRYAVGETFGRHHDAEGQAHAPNTPGGPRVWTLYLFLTGESTHQRGGAFRMPRLNVSVEAQAGRAVLWPHLLDADLVTPDMRTEHEGAPVLEGVKYAHRYFDSMEGGRSRASVS